MPKLPDINALGERPIPDPQAGVVSLRAPSAASYEAGAGMLAQVGAGAARASDVLYEFQRQTDELRAEDAYNALREKQLELTVGEKNGFVHRKGGDAVNAPLFQDYNRLLEDEIRTIGEQLQNPAQKEFFRRRAAVTRIQFSEHILRHVTQERGAYSEQVYNGTVATELGNISTQYLDPNAMALSITRMEAAADTVAREKGLDATKLKMDLKDKAQLARFQSWAFSDPIKATTAFKEVAADPKAMTPGMRLQIDAMLKERAEPIENKNEADRYIGETVRDIGAGKVSFPREFTPQSMPQLISAVIHEESRGNPKAVSPKGARGIMQLLPDTARATAQRLGLPYDEARLTSDPEYNKQLGTAYLNEQLQRFGGNIAAATAAYNAGPAVVADWINGTNESGKNPKKIKLGDPSKGEISDSEFAKKIPFAETKAYVGNILKAVGSGGMEPGGVTGKPSAKDYRAILPQVEAKIMKDYANDPVKRDKIINQTRGQFQVLIQGQEAVERQAHDFLIAKAEGVGTQTGMIPTGGATTQQPMTTMTGLLSDRESWEAWNNLPGNLRAAIRTRVEANSRQAGEAANAVSVALYKETLPRLLLPDSDPRKIRTETQITELFNQGLLTNEKDKLVRALRAVTTPGGELVEHAVQSALQRAERSFFSDEASRLMAEFDPMARAKLMHLYEMDVRGKIDAKLKAKEDPMVLFRPLIGSTPNKEYVLDPSYMMGIKTRSSDTLQKEADKAVGTPKPQPGKIYDIDPKNAEKSYAAIPNGARYKHPDGSIRLKGETAGGRAARTERAYQSIPVPEVDERGRMK